MVESDQDPAESPEDDVRAKFREALERKQGRGGGTHEGHAHGGGKASHASSSAAHQKEFRRKAGG